MHYQQGVARGQESLLPARIEDYVAVDHPVRVIDAFVDRMDMVQLGFRHATLGATGRPPYDPRDLLKLFSWGYLNRVRSTRGLEREAGRNLEVLWLLGGLRPDFKTLSNFRRANGESIARVCREFVQFCRGQGLFGGTLVAIDGTKLQAVASSKAVWTAERLAEAQAKLIESTRKYVAELGDSESADGGDESDKSRVMAALAALSKRAELLGKVELALAENAERPHVATEPDAKQMRTAHNGRPVAYNVQTAVDSQHGLIAAHAVTDAGNDHQQLLPMAVLAKEALQVERLSVVADTGYQNGDQAKACEDQGILPAVPMQKRVNPRSPDCFTKAQFQYDEASDTYRCPADQVLKRFKTERKTGTAFYSCKACASCPLRPQCTQSSRRTIVRERNASSAEAADRRATAEMLRQRRCLAEHPFGTIKWLLGLPRFLLRGYAGASTEMALVVNAYNLKRVIQILGVPVLLAKLNAAA